MMDLLAKTQRGLKERRVIKIMRQLFKAIDHMHAQGIAHRDIKRDNILQSKNGIVKLADFGTVNFGDPGCRNMSTVRCGTIPYSPPEVLGLTVPYCAEEADMWSAGIVCHALLTNSFAFGNQSEIMCETTIDNMWWKESSRAHGVSSMSLHRCGLCWKGC